VALSRGVELGRVRLFGFNRNVVKAHPKVVAFYTQLQNVAAAAAAAAGVPRAVGVGAAAAVASRPSSSAAGGAGQAHQPVGRAGLGMSFAAAGAGSHGQPFSARPAQQGCVSARVAAAGGHRPGDVAGRVGADGTAAAAEAAAAATGHAVHAGEGDEYADITEEEWARLLAGT
jgi:hypothetical protein